jgi:hypothetical protein
LIFQLICRACLFFHDTTFRRRANGRDDNDHQISATRYRRGKTLRLLFRQRTKRRLFRSAERTRGLAYVKLQPSHQLRLDETARQAEDRAQPPTPAKEVRNQIKLWPKQRICRAPHLRKMMSARTSLANPTKSTMKTAVPESLSFAAVGDAWKKRSPNLTRFAERPLRPPSPARSTSDRARD